jgi:selenocysteine lyase/cysteine desulfurase
LNRAVDEMPYGRRSSDAISSGPNAKATPWPIACNPGTMTDPLRAVENAMAAFRDAVRGRPVEAYARGREALAQLRVAAAQAFGGDAAGWALADGFTSTIDRLANAIVTARGGHATVITTESEHIGGLGAFTNDPRYTVVEVPIERIAEAEGDLYFLSHVAYDTNRDNSHEIQVLVRRADAPVVIVDGNQAIGQIDVNVVELGCHAYASSAHKWLGGPQGTGLLFLRRDMIGAWPVPFRAGEPLCRELPIGLWEPRGGQDFSRIAGLVAAIREYQGNALRGRDLRGQFVAKLERALGDLVHVLPVSAPSGRVAVFELTGLDPYPVYRRLADRGLSVKCIKRSDGSGSLEVLRVGFPWWAPATRVQEAVNVLAEVVGEFVQGARTPQSERADAA